MAEAAAAQSCAVRGASAGCEGKYFALCIGIACASG